MSELTRYPTWLRTHLGLRDPDIPTQLETGAGVLAVVDVLSAGIRDTEARRFAVTSTLNGPQPQTDMSITPSGEIALASGALNIYDPSWASIGYVSIEQNGGGAASVNVRHYFKPSNNTPDSVYLASGLALNAGVRLTHSQLRGSPRPIVLPGDSRVDVDISGVAVGGSVILRWAGIRVPAAALEWFW